MLTSELLESARTLGPRIVSDRRTIHSHPEMAYDEQQTSTLVQARLRDLGIPFRSGLATTGVVAQIKGELGDGPCVLLRADMDALPIEERSGVPFASEIPGVMHACGHDAHTAMLLGAAQLLLERRSRFAGTVKLMFQPAEEGGAGAARMINDGVLDDPKVDAAFMLHVRPELEVGQVSYGAGPLLAGADAFTITVEGRGGHAARPHDSIDPVVVGAQIVVAAQTLVAREVDPTTPAVVTLGSFNAGNRSNVIADFAILKGTIRAFDDDLLTRLEKRLSEIVSGVASTMRATARIDFEMRYPPSVCDSAMAERLGASARDLLGSKAVQQSRPVMGAEDFAFVLQRVPGAMLWLGVKHPSWAEPKPLHTATFDIDEAALPIGSSAMAGVALDYLSPA
ncbi:MAG: M20 metallopeptidase family protein [Candidatus Dormibacteraceae bacterium]